MKSLRFARRALELYSQGLTSYPQNFDLAYNKARLELEIATHPALVKHLDVPVNEILQQALSSHYYALGLDPNNADLLFNASQVLTTIAEQVAKDDSISDVEAARYLQQALEYQSRCLEIQELKFTESRVQHEQALQQGTDEEDDDGGAKLDVGTRSAFEDKEEEEQWVSIVEPVTADTLVDTVLAQLGTLTTLCSIITSMSSSDTSLTPVVAPAWIESYGTKVIDGALTNILTTSRTELQPRAREINLAKAIFSSALYEMAYRSQSIDIQVYKENIGTAFASRELDSDMSALVAHSRALIALNSAIAETSITVSASTSADPYFHANVRWASLSEAQSLLTAASKISPDDATLTAATHALRGDISLLLIALSDAPISHPQAISNRTQLFRNAEVFYRNATKLFNSLEADEENDKERYQFRGGVVRVLQELEKSGSESTSTGALVEADAQAVSSIQTILRDASKSRDDVWRREHLEEMVDEGLVRGELFGIS